MSKRHPTNYKEKQEVSQFSTYLNPFLISPTEIFYSVEDGSIVLANLNDNKCTHLRKRRLRKMQNLVTADDVQIPCEDPWSPRGVLPPHGILKLPLNFVTADQ